ncbi:MAG: hypothetical protein E6K17_06330 [Methanobacteriota archaeon]|nr:MAG: hypothetical protein E6K17_06330 [Euryarchaeota archaeon]
MREDEGKGDGWKRRLEEYKLTLESRHHHERTMWQLLGLDLAMTGLLLQFWLQTVPGPFGPRGAESNAFLILFVPLFLGIFAASALLKHKFFWNLELRRAIQLDAELEFQRDSAFAREYYLSRSRYVRSFDMAFLAVIVITLGMAALIGRSFWIKPPILQDHIFWFPLYVLAILVAIVGYGAVRKVQLDEERKRYEMKRFVPLPGTRAVVVFWGSYTSNVSLAIAGSLRALAGMDLLTSWTLSPFTWLSFVLVFSSMGVFLIARSWLASHKSF